MGVVRTSPRRPLTLSTCIDSIARGSPRCSLAVSDPRSSWAWLARAGGITARGPRLGTGDQRNRAQVTPACQREGRECLAPSVNPSLGMTNGATIPNLSTAPQLAPPGPALKVPLTPMGAKFFGLWLSPALLSQPGVGNLPCPGRLPQSSSPGSPCDCNWEGGGHCLHCSVGIGSKAVASQGIC